MSRTYTDYHNKTAITLPETFIDVKTGDSYSVTPKIQEQIEYHAKNSTLIHLVLSALNQYLHPRALHGGTEEILFELSEIKRIMQKGNTFGNTFQNHNQVINRPNKLNASIEVDMKELEEIIDAFGG